MLKKGEKGQCGEKWEFSSLPHFVKITLRYVAVIQQTPLLKKWGQLVALLATLGGRKCLGRQVDLKALTSLFIQGVLPGALFQSSLIIPSFLS